MNQDSIFMSSTLFCTCEVLCATIPFNFKTTPLLARQSYCSWLKGTTDIVELPAESLFFAPSVCYVTLLRPNRCPDRTMQRFDDSFLSGLERACLGGRPQRRCKESGS